MKDRDEQQRAFRFYSLPLAMLAGAMVFATTLLVAKFPLWLVLLLSALAAVLGWKAPDALAGGAASMGTSLYHHSGKSTPPPAQYSLADSLVARGKYEEAEEAFTLLSEDFPLDPEPRIRLARFLRDKHQRHEDAAKWFRAALSVETIDSAVEVGITRELIEVYTHKLRTPEKALPYLKKLMEKYPQHPAAQWAQSEYAEIKNEMNAKRSS